MIRRLIVSNDSTASPPPEADTAGPPGGPTRHTIVGIALNLLLLAVIAYGFWQSEAWRWAWGLVAVPIVVVTIRYAAHLRGARPGARPGP